MPRQYKAVVIWIGTKIVNDPMEQNPEPENGPMYTERCIIWLIHS